MVVFWREIKKARSHFDLQGIELKWLLVFITWMILATATLPIEAIGRAARSPDGASIGENLNTSLTAWKTLRLDSPTHDHKLKKFQVAQYLDAVASTSLIPLAEVEE
jgi:hypothetical protein